MPSSKGRQQKAKASQSKQKTKQILDRYQRDQSLLVSILQDIQAEYRYLPKEALEEVSQSLGIPLTRVYSVGTFFKAFSLKPRGRHLINVCLGTACHVRGAGRVLEQIERELGIEAGETTEDLRFTMERVNCVGACALGPIIIVDEQYSGEMATDKVKPLLEKYK
ncbi:NADH-quinone oxidoreductase subunit NuoE [Chloroflexota bacterium]